VSFLRKFQNISSKESTQESGTNSDLQGAEDDTVILESQVESSVRYCNAIIIYVF